jgi:hypothetical protein
MHRYTISHPQHGILVVFVSSTKTTKPKKFYGGIIGYCPSLKKEVAFVDSWIIE